MKSNDEVDLAILARSTPGYSGADLAAIVNEAAIMAVLEKRDEVFMEHLEESRDKVRYGITDEGSRLNLNTATDAQLRRFFEAAASCSLRPTRRVCSGGPTTI